MTRKPDYGRMLKTIEKLRADNATLNKQLEEGWRKCLATLVKAQNDNLELRQRLEETEEKLVLAVVARDLAEYRLEEAEVVLEDSTSLMRRILNETDRPGAISAQIANNLAALAREEKP
jgi:hypothetical protein